jgi:hypothetical protein
MDGAHLIILAASKMLPPEFALLGSNARAGSLPSFPQFRLVCVDRSDRDLVAVDGIDPELRQVSPLCLRA